MVTNRAVNFIYKGMVIWGILFGVTRLVIRKPAKILPSARRLIELINDGLFSLIIIRVG